MSDQANLEAALERRGVNGQLAAWIAYWMEADAIERTLAWYDRQGARIGPGMLVSELRKGGTPPDAHAALAERDRLHAAEQRAWLEANCPEIASHLAAAPALGRLRYAHRHAPLEDAELAARVREAVADFDRHNENSNATGEGEEP